MKRREDLLADVGRLPDWLPRFDLAAWVDESEQPPDWWAHSVGLYRHIGAHRRWCEAGREWLAERGQRDRWFELTRAKVVAR